jgi:hypothetical protein
MREVLQLIGILKLLHHMYFSTKVIVEVYMLLLSPGHKGVFM